MKIVEAHNDVPNNPVPKRNQGIVEYRTPPVPEAVQNAYADLVYPDTEDVVTIFSNRLPHGYKLKKSELKIILYTYLDRGVTEYDGDYIIPSYHKDKIVERMVNHIAFGIVEK